MSRLEDKLKELGYQSVEKIGCFEKNYAKYVNDMTIIIKVLNWIKVEIEDYYVSGEREIKTQQDIDNLQQVFDVMTKDLEILKGCEDK